MEKVIKALLLLCALCAFAACGKERKMTYKRIREMSNRNPELAAKMMDSVSTEDVNHSEYWRMKYDLLKTRIDDKRYRIATSDIRIKKVAEYFEQHGDNFEKQEAYYYAGSVCRDLKDHPQSLAYFLKSEATCNHGEAFDSTLLRNTYSNLCNAYYMVQDYDHAAEMATREYELAKKLHENDAATTMSLSASLARAGKRKKAIDKLIESYGLLSRTDSVFRHSTLSSLLYHFSTYGLEKYADECFLKAKKEWDFSKLEGNDCMALGRYFICKNKPDSAIFYFEATFHTESQLEHKRDASKNLLKAYAKTGNDRKATRYGLQFARLNDSLDLGERQRRAATINNEFRYQREKAEEEKLIKRSETYRTYAWYAIFLLVTMVSVSISFISYRRNKSLKVRDKLQHELQAYELRAKGLDKQIRDAEELQSELLKALDNAQQEISAKEKEMEQNRSVSAELNEQIRQSEEERLKNEELLSEKIAQNKSLIQLIRESAIEEKPGGILNIIEQAARKKRTLTRMQWNTFFATMNEKYPTFDSTLYEKLGVIKMDKRKVCYLMRAGLQGPQIANLTQLPRTTIWRWVKELEWIGQLS